MDRRDFLFTAGAALLAGPALAEGLPVPPGNAVGFKVFHNGGQIGEHHLNFTQNGDALVIDIAMQASGRIDEVFPFTYQAAITERWLGGVFQSVDSKVNFNGNLLHVHAHKVAGGYDVTSSNRDHPEKCWPEYTAPANTLPLTYWNKAMLDGTVLNIQTGHSYPVTVTSPGWENLPTANGGKLLAQRFDVTGKLHLSVWYDHTDQWAGLDLPLYGHLTYEKIV
jgi:hypothetical protein